MGLQSADGDFLAKVLARGHVVGYDTNICMAYALEWIYPNICCSRGRGGEVVVGVGIGVQSLLEQPVEEQAPRAAGAAVEPERELVEVVVELADGLAVVEGASEPAFEQ